jgi:RNA polymerase sigma factor (sigma-70 family)
VNDSREIYALTEMLYRQEAGKMVAVLTRIFGSGNLEMAEDVVQQTFIDAIRVWKEKEVPSNPPGWLFRVAKNKAIDVIRRNRHSVQFDFNDTDRKLLTSEYTLEAAMENFWNEEDIKDDQLRMMFTCCHSGISQISQVTLILKTLCGFTIPEISKAFLTPEDTISKRLYRSKEFLRDQKMPFIIPSGNELKSRTRTVLNSIYLLFNEGYNSTDAQQLIRKDLIQEAMMLGRMLTENKFTQLPETFALMALMYFHASRIDSRLTAEGEIILLPFQDRTKWNRELISLGNVFMNKAATGNEISSYHLEAAIAYEHATADTFDNTNWKQILEYYDLLIGLSSSPVVELNRAVAVLYTLGPEAALKAVEEISHHAKLKSFYLYYSLLGEIYARLNQQKKSEDFFRLAIEQTTSEIEKKLLQGKIAAMYN